MEGTVDTRTALLRHRKALLHSLIELAGKTRQAQAQAIVADLEVTDRALATLEPAPKTKYVGYKNAILAVLAYLDEKGRSATVDEISSAVAAGGFRGGVPGTVSNIQRSISSYLSGQHKDTQTLRLVGERVGRHEWPLSAFSLDE